MAILDITEYEELAVSSLGYRIPAGQEPSITTQQLAIGAESDQSVAFSDRTKFIRLHADVACRVAIGDNPTASSASMRVGVGGFLVLGDMAAREASPDSMAAAGAILIQGSMAATEQPDKFLAYAPGLQRNLSGGGFIVNVGRMMGR